MLVNGEVPLREIIDLGATYVGNNEGNGAASPHRKEDPMDQAKRKVDAP